MLNLDYLNFIYYYLCCLVLPIRNAPAILISSIIYLFVRFLPILRAEPVIIELLHSFGEKLAVYRLIAYTAKRSVKQASKPAISYIQILRPPAILAESIIYIFILFLILSSNLTHLFNKRDRSR